jgi:hypothetical protein
MYACDYSDVAAFVAVGCCLLQVLDITWPPLRQADYSISLAWLAAALAALAAANTLLGS